jgi:hypothetical protein
MGTSMIGPPTLCPRRFCPRTVRPGTVHPYFVLSLYGIPERAGCSKRTFPDCCVPGRLIPKGKGCVFKHLFPDYLCVEKIRNTQ